MSRIHRSPKPSFRSLEQRTNLTAIMKGKLPAAALYPRSYTYFEPRSEWSQDDEGHMLAVDVSGFKKEQLKVLMNTAGILTISGERHIDGNRWSRFRRQFRIPENCHVEGIKAKLDTNHGMLYVILPKPGSQAHQQCQPQQMQQAADKADATNDRRGEASQKATSDGREDEGEMEEQAHDMRTKSGLKLADEGTKDSPTSEYESPITNGGMSGFIAGLRRNLKLLLIVNIVVPVAIAGLAIYLRHRLRSSLEGENE